MVRCRPKNPRAKENYKELSKYFGKKEARILISQNNGYSLEDDKLGEKSLLFENFLKITDGDRKKAFNLKASIYNRTFTSEPHISEFKIENDRIVDLKESEYPVERVNSTFLREARMKATFLGKNYGAEPVGGIGSTTDVKTSNPTQLAKDINTFYGIPGGVAKPMKGYVQIGLNEQQVSFVRKQIIEKERKNLERQVLNETIRRGIEANMHQQEAFDDENDLFPTALTSLQDGEIIYDNDLHLDDTIDENFSMKRRREKRERRLKIQQRKELGLSVTKTDKQKDYLQYKRYLENDLEYMTNRLDLLTEKHKLAPTGKRKKQINKQISRITSVVRRLENQISQLTNKKSVLDNIKEMAKEDAKRVRELLGSDNYENVLEATKITEWYSSLGRFNEKGDHPFFKNKFAVQDKTVRDLLDGIADEFTEMNTQIQNVTMKKVLNELSQHKGFKKLKKIIESEDFTLDDKGRKQKVKVDIDYIFNSEVPDIDMISRYFLNILMTYDFKTSGDQVEPILSQYIYHIFADSYSKNTGFARDKIEQLEASYDIVKGKIKKLGGFPVFYQKNTSGGLSQYLISSFTPEWNRMVKKLNSYSGRKRFEETNKHADIIDPRRIPEVKAKFEDTINETFASDTEAKRYSTELKEKFGKKTTGDNHEYNRLVEEQIRKIDQFNTQYDALIAHWLGKFGVHYISQLPDKQQREIKKFDLQNNPFRVVDADATGTIKENFGKGTIETKVSLNHSAITPKPEHSQYFDKDFDKITADEDVYNYWNLLNESFSYINLVNAATGQTQLTFDSIPHLEKSITDGFLDQSLPFGHIAERALQGAKYAYGKIKDSTKRYLGTAGDELNIKTDDKVNASTLKSLTPIINERYRLYRDYTETFLIEDDEAGEDEDAVFKFDNYDETDPVQKKFLSFIGKFLSKEQKNKFKSEDGITHEEIKEALYQGAQQEIIEQQTLNLNKLAKYFLSHASRVEAAIEVLPQLKILKRLYEDIKTPEGNIRTNAVGKMNNWFERVIMGHYGLSGMGIGKKMRTEAEKREYEILEDMNERLMQLQQKGDLKERMGNLGQKFNLLTILSVFHSLIILRSMSYNFVSGALNIMYGMVSNYLFDSTEFIWKRDNGTKATHFVTSGFIRSVSQYKIAKLFINKSWIIQDMRNEKQKAAGKMGKRTLRQKLKPFYLSITGPEWVNQSITILSVLQDYYITDRNGNEVQIFDGNKFPAYDNVNARGVPEGEWYEQDGKRRKSKGGMLRLKDEFRYTDKDNKIENKKNIKNWERIVGGKFSNFRTNSGSVGIVSGHGDYNPNLGIAIKQTILGRLFMTFTGYLPPMVHLFWGAGVNMFAGTRRKRSMARNLPPTTAGIVGSIVGMASTGNPYWLGTGALVYAAQAALRGKSSPQMQDVKEAWASIQSILAEHINFPSSILFGTRPIDPGVNRLNLSDDEKRAINLYSRSMALALMSILARNLAFNGLRCEDDTEWCKKQTMIRNAIINFVSNIQDDVFTPNNPFALLARYLSSHTAERAGQDIANLIEQLDEYDKESNIMIGGKYHMQSKLGRSFDRVFLPSVIKHTGAYSFGSGKFFADDPLLTREVFDDRDIYVILTDKDIEAKVEKYIRTERAKYKAMLKAEYEKMGIKEKDIDESDINRLMREAEDDGLVPITLTKIRNKIAEHNRITEGDPLLDTLYYDYIKELYQGYN